MDDADHRTDAPLACTLGADDGPARLRRWQRLHEAAPPVARMADGRLEVRYPPGRNVTQELAQLAAGEQLCCSFVDWSVTEDDAGPVLRVSAPPDAPDAVAPIAALFGVPALDAT